MSSTPVLSLDDYKSSEDSDYAPEELIGTKDDETSSDDVSESDQIPERVRAKKRKFSHEKLINLDIGNSGDEMIIAQTKLKKSSKKKKKVKNSEDNLSDNGVMKTRSNSAQERKELEKPRIIEVSTATIDVDAVWQAMISGKPLPGSNNSTNSQSNTFSEPLSTIHKHKDSENLQNTARSGCLTPKQNDNELDSTTKIKYNYKFAGKVHSCEKIVPLESAEAKLYHETLLKDPASKSNSSDSSTAFKRPVKLARRSTFEPISYNLTPRSDLHLGVRNQKISHSASTLALEKKLNTVEKSALDWASFVDEEGFADELIAAGKSKDAFKARQEFLARVEQKKEIESRRARGLPV